MKIKRRTLRLAGAACILSCTAFAFQAFAAARVAGARCVEREPDVLLHGKVLLAYGRFELNVMFTPDGRIQRFRLNSAPRLKG